MAELLGVRARSVGRSCSLRAGDLRGRLEASWWCTRRRWCLLGLLLKQWCQVGPRGPHGLGDLDHDALVERELIAFVQLIAVFVVRVAEEVAGLVVHHDPAVEGVELEVAIVPFLLLLANVGCVEAAELCDGRRLRRGDLRMRRATEGCRHRLGGCVRCAQGALQDMGGDR